MNVTNILAGRRGLWHGSNLMFVEVTQECGMFAWIPLLHVSEAPSWGAKRHRHHNVDINASGYATGWSGESCQWASHQPDSLAGGSTPSSASVPPDPTSGWEVVIGMEGSGQSSPPYTHTRNSAVLCGPEIIHPYISPPTHTHAHIHTHCWVSEYIIILWSLNA